MNYLFQKFARSDFFQYGHLLDGNLVQSLQPLALGDAVTDKNSIQIFHIGQAYQNVVYNWRLLGCIEITETVTASNGKQQAVRFRKK